MVNNGKVTYAGVIVDKDTFHIVENRDSIFEIGSLTKVFTSVLLSTFVNKGDVKIEDHIQDYFDYGLKDGNVSGKQITLGMLANHTSGLPRIDMSMMNNTTDMNDPYAKYDEKALKDYLQNKMKLDTVPGVKFSYSNLGGGLLGYILCQKEHSTYENLVQNNIFKPLGMNNSTTFLAYVKDKMVKGRNAAGAITANWNFTDATAGAGAIKSNATDMVKFMQANFTPNKVYDLPRVRSFTISDKMFIGLGWLCKVERAKDNIYWHNGGTGGYRSCLAMDIEKKSGVIILSNVSSFHPLNANIDKLCFALLSSLSR